MPLPAQFFNNERLSDLKLQVKGQGKVYNVHKFALAANSAYFSNLLDGPTLQDSTTKNRCILLLKLPALLETTFENTLRFMYEGNIELDKHSVLKYYVLADLLSCELLKKECVQYICDSIRVTVEDKTQRLFCFCWHR